MGNILSYASDPGGSPLLDDKWRNLSLDFFFNFDFLVKEFQNLPLFDGTVLPDMNKDILRRKLNHNISIENDLKDVYCKDSSIPTSDNVMALVDECLELNVTPFSVELEKKMRTRTMLRLHLAITRHLDAVSLST